jgi:SAM-dependent methyltransferase
MNLYDSIAAIYDADMGASMDLPDLECYLHAARAVDGPVLELGCGNGRVLAALQSAGIDAVGIDLSLPMLHGARERCGPSIALARMDLRQLALRASFALALLPYSLVTQLRNDEDWRRLAAGLRAALRPRAAVLLDAFIPRPELGDRGWLPDYARRVGVNWLVRHKRISRLGDGCSRIERRYRCRGSFGGRTLHTSEIIRPYTPIELQLQVERFLGPVLVLEYDYGVDPGSKGRRFCTVTALLA